MAPVNTQQNSNAPSGTNIVLLFNKPLPSLKAADIKKILAPVNTQQNSNAASGTNIVLMFNKPIPALKASDIKKMLAPVLDFEKETATENYVDKLPEPVQKAIKANKAMEGMNRDEVLLALGRPRRRERNVTKDGAETEDWIYGDPPGKITFVVFTGSKVTEIKEAYADVGGSTAAPVR